MSLRNAAASRETRILVTELVELQLCCFMGREGSKICINHYLNQTSFGSNLASLIRFSTVQITRADFGPTGLNKSQRMLEKVLL